jgi:hypothetical protein
MAMKSGKIAPTIDPAFAIDMTAARMHHPVISPKAAQAIARFPILVRPNFLSLMILASTGKAVMLMATPMNRLKGRKPERAFPYSLNKK